MYTPTSQSIFATSKPNEMEFIERRNRDLMRQISEEKRRILSNGIITTIDTAIRSAAEAPAPSYYVSFDHARRCVSALLRGVAIPNSRSRRGQMMIEIGEKCRRLLETNTDLKISDALARVLTSESATSFFISFAQARNIYFNTRRAARHNKNRLRTRRLF